MSTRRIVPIVLMSACVSTVALAQKPAEEDYGKKFAGEMNACAIVCLDEVDLVFFGAFTVPFERPSVEFCGEWMSQSAEARAQYTRKETARIEREAIDRKYSPKEKQELRRKALEKTTRCETDFKKRCEDTKKQHALAARKKAVESTRKAIADAGPGRTDAIQKYFNYILGQCSLEE
jgi:hypothetical protein